MANSKQYTQVNYAKDVDFDGDPEEIELGTEPALCTQCGAVLSNKRWMPSQEASARERVHAAPPRLTLCPACKQANDDVPGGVLTVRGAFASAHRDEIENLLRAEASGAYSVNPLARVMHFDWNEGELTVVTTTGQLAQRLGRALERSYKGAAEFTFSDGDGPGRVTWQRD
jgi:hypothetical protein